MISISPNKLRWFLRAIPNFAWPLKVICIKISLKKSGSNLRIGPNSFLFDHRVIEVGDNVYIGDASIIMSKKLVRIGNNVLFGPEVMLIGGDHNFKIVGKPMAHVHNGGVDLPITIEDDVWIGARTTILKGVTIGEGAIVGACSVVTKNILPYSINVGNPVKYIRCRFNRQELIKHFKIVKSKYSFEEVNLMYNAKDFEIE